MKLVLASKNKGKLRELQAMLRDTPVEVLLESQVGIDLEVEDVTIKATTTERLGFEGREEGVSAYATALVVKL